MLQLTEPAVRATIVFLSNNSPYCLHVLFLIPIFVHVFLLFLIYKFFKKVNFLSIILDLQKIMRIVRRFSIFVQPVFPIINISIIPLVIINEPVLTYYYLKSYLYSDIWFLPLFCSRIPSRIPHYIQSSISPKLLWARYFLRPSLFLMTLAVLRSTGQVFCRISSNWDLSHIFLILWLGLYVLRRPQSESTFPYITLSYQHNLSLLLTWLRKCPSGLSTVKLLYFYPFSYCHLWEELCADHT